MLTPAGIDQSKKLEGSQDTFSKKRGGWMAEEVVSGGVKEEDEEDEAYKDACFSGSFLNAEITSISS
jgi:hypothetical protein